jgi:transcriptional regulator with XRE-family HTH domain
MMANERLRSALLERGVTLDNFAAAINVDVKTIERWITKNRTPYPRHRQAVAAFLKTEEFYLWPDALSTQQAVGASQSEIINVFPHRWTVPSELWRRHFETAREELGLLVYSGTFVAEDTGILRVFRSKADAGARVRLLFGDPESEEMTRRCAEEGLDEGSVKARVRNTLTLIKALRAVEGIEIRLHSTVLYNSLFRADEQLLVNAHIYSFPASLAPVLHLRRVAGGTMVSGYLESFEKVWNNATPWGVE